MNRLIFCTVVGALCTSGSFASFELMLIADQTASGGRVVRVDPETRASLGSFGLGKIAGNIRDIAVDQSLGRCYVLGSSLVSEFNYNTGEFISAFTVGSFSQSISFAPSTGHLITSGHGTSNVDPIRRYKNGATVNSVSTGFSTSGVAELGGQQFVGVGNSSSAPTIVSVPSTSTTDIVAHTSTLPNGLVNSYRDLTVAGGKLWASYVDADSIVRLRSFSVTGGLLNTPTDSATLFGSFTSERISLATGHGDVIYLLRGSNLYTYHAPSNTYLGDFTVPGLTSGGGRGMALIVAPEPASCVALGLGALAVMRRRRGQ